MLKAFHNYFLVKVDKLHAVYTVNDSVLVSVAQLYECSLTLNSLLINYK